MWILWVGPIWRWLAYVHYFIRLTNVFDNTMLVTETWIVRMSTEWIWKRPPTIHEDFFAIFIPALNIVLAVWFSWLQFLTGERGHQSIIRHTGSKDLDWPMADFTLNIDIMVIGLAGLSAIAYLVNEVAAKIKDHCCNNRNIDAVISLDPGFSDEDQGPEARFTYLHNVGIGIKALLNPFYRWNNMAKNDQFVGTTMQLLAGISVIGGLVWAYQGLGLRRSDDDEQFQMWIMEVSIIQICFVPSLIFLKKSKLRKHFVTKIKHILRV